MTRKPYIVTFDQGTLFLRGHDRDDIESLFGENVWTWDPRVDAWRCEAVHYRIVITKLWSLRQQDVEYQDQAKNWTDVKWKTQNIHPPRPEQQTAIENWGSEKRGVVVMPTGTGKTEGGSPLARSNQVQHADRCPSSRFDVPVASPNFAGSRI